jgi:hypothetical protein
VRDLSLFQLRLAPSSLLLLRFEDDKMNVPSFPAPLLPSVLKQAIDLPLPPDAPQEPSAKASTSGGKTLIGGGGRTLSGGPSASGGPSVLNQMESFGAEAEKKISKFFKGLTSPSLLAPILSVLISFPEK